jgi:hypothetical protein
MKVKLFILLAFAVNICNSQDIIIMKNGDEIKAKVQEVGTEEVKYKKFGTEAPIYVVERIEIFMIKYENGNKDVFNDEEKSEEEDKIVEHYVSQTPVEDMYFLGKEDASMYYSGKNSGAGGVFVSTLLLGGIIGLIPTGIIVSKEPKTINLNLPDNSLANNSKYMFGYREQAHKIKRKKVWASYGSAFITSICFYYLIILVY